MSVRVLVVVVADAPRVESLDVCKAMRALAIECLLRSPIHSRCPATLLIKGSGLPPNIAGKRLRQNSDASKVELADPLVFVLGEIATVHVGLGDDERVVEKMHLRRPAFRGNPVECLVQEIVSGGQFARKNKSRNIRFHVVLQSLRTREGNSA